MTSSGGTTGPARRPETEDREVGEVTVFADRAEAGRQLADRLAGLRGADPVILGLPRGGVPVAAEVARALGAPLDVVVVRKLGVPSQPELAMGAIGEEDVRVLAPEVLRLARVADDELTAVERRERAALEARVARLRRGRDRVELTGRLVVIVDDGIATGSTARAACLVARGLGAARVVLAVPVAPADVVHHLPEADEIVCVRTPSPFIAVGRHYRDFAPTSDDDVIALLDEAARRDGGRSDAGLPDAGLPAAELEVTIPVGAGDLAGLLHLPEPATGVVLFAHGSGSGRHSPRNGFVAQALHGAGLGTLLLDLLTPEEALDRANVFDLDLLARRLAAATRWLLDRPDAAGARLGYFGASTGAGAALRAAADHRSPVAAIVSRGGRPDLAGPRLAEVRAPTLLIVGGADPVVLELNRHAQAQLRCENHLAIVRGATHLFEEPGALAEVAMLATDWFRRRLLTPGPDPAAPG